MPDLGKQNTYVSSNYHTYVNINHYVSFKMEPLEFFVHIRICIQHYWVNVFIYICDLIVEDRPSCHIWYFEKYQF